jgi:uncharacterized damage-inducible protein DinB
MQIQIIIKQIQRVFNGPAWHGPSVIEALSKIDEQRKNSSFKNSHSIIELIAHMTSWRKFVIAKLNGDESYSVSNEMNFPKPSDLNEAMAELKSSQEDLVKLVSSFPEERLADKVTGQTYSYQTMLHGILHHDLYHLGQISLLNR